MHRLCLIILFSPPSFLEIILSVLLRHTDYDYPFGIFKLPLITLIFKLFFSFFALERWYYHTEIIKLTYMYITLLEALYCTTIIDF